MRKKNFEPVILMYHSVGEVFRPTEIGADLYSVSVNKFSQQMRYIAGVIKPWGLQTMGRDILITFDDGLLNNYTRAYPILEEFGLKAYFFLLVERIGMPGYMNWGQIQQLKEAGMVIGSHGMTHKILTELEDEDLDYEIKQSKIILEAKLGQTIEYFSVSRGFYNQKVINRIREAGYKAVFTSAIKDCDGFKLGRIAIKRNWNLKQFIKALNGNFFFRDKAGELFKKSTKRILGAKNYDRLRTMVLSG